MTGRRLSLFLALFLVFTANAQAAITVPVVVKLLPGVNLSLITNLLGGTLIDSIPGTNTHLLRLPNLPVLTFTLRLLGVEWLELDRGIGVSKNHPIGVLGVQGGTPADFYKSQPAFKLVRADQALLHSTGSGVIIADINSRTDYSHPALIGHLANGYDFVTGRPSDVADLHDDQSGIFSLDDDQSGIFSLDDDQSGIFSLDENSGSKSHGTFVAGILAAVAPNATIMPLRAFDDAGNTDLFTLAKAIHYARQNGATVINMSFGTLTASKVLKEAIDYAKAGGVTLVASAGNSNTSAKQYPAAYTGVITVAATDLMDRKASFSNYGSYVFAGAPGVNMISALPDGRYGIAHGTSFSAPIVAGMAALIRSRQLPGVSTAISNNTVDIDWRNPGYADKLGYGRVDIKGAVD